MLSGSAFGHGKIPRSRTYDSIGAFLVRRSYRDAIVDSTRWDGRVRIKLKRGAWWVTARAVNVLDPNREWYWNVRVSGDTIRLDPKSAGSAEALMRFIVSPDSLYHPVGRDGCRPDDGGQTGPARHAHEGQPDGARDGVRDVLLPVPVLQATGRPDLAAASRRSTSRRARCDGSSSTIRWCRSIPTRCRPLSW